MPALLSRRRDTKVAGDRIVARAAGLGGDRRRGDGGRGRCAGEAAGAFSSSSCSAFSIRAVSLPPGTQRLSRASVLPAIASE